MYDRLEDPGVAVQVQEAAAPLPPLGTPMDIALLGGNKDELDDGLNEIYQILVDKIKIKINMSKNKVLICTKKRKKGQECTKISGENLEEVKEFHNREIKSRGTKGPKVLKWGILYYNTKMLVKTYAWKT